MKKIWRIYRKFIIISLNQLTIFRGSFLIFIGWLLLDLLIKILFFSAIFNQVDSIGGWTFQDSILLVFFLGMMWDFLWVLFLAGFEDFLLNFSRGQFDFILTKPINPLIYLSLSSFNAKSFSFSRYLLLIYIIIFAPYVWQIENLAIAAIIFLLTIIVFHAIYTMIISLAFWLTENILFFYNFHQIIEGSTQPISIYPPILRFIFTFILPILLIANYPVMAIKGLVSWPAVGLVLALAIIFELVAYSVWSLGVRRYSSASS